MTERQMEILSKVTKTILRVYYTVYCTLLGILSVITFGLSYAFSFILFNVSRKRWLRVRDMIVEKNELQDFSLNECYDRLSTIADVPVDKTDNAVVTIIKTIYRYWKKRMNEIDNLTIDDE